MNCFNVLVIVDSKMTRRLTEIEIKDMLSFIRPIPGLPQEIGEAIAAKHFENHAKQLRNISLYPSKIPAMKQIMERSYFKSQIEPGKSVGALSSSSIGERNTQSSLSSFHEAGQSKVQLLVGVPRLEEIVNVTRNIKTPCMETRFLLPREQLADLNIVKRKSQALLEYKEVTDFLIDYDLKENREIDEADRVWYSFHRMFYGEDYESCNWSVRLIFDVNLLHNYDRTLLGVGQVIESIYADSYCVCSPDNIGIIDVYVATDGLGDVDSIVESIKATRKKGKKKREADEDEDLVMLIDDNNKEYYFLRDLVIPSLCHIQLGGIEGIEKCFYLEDKDGWYITTKGSNLRALIRCPFIDISRTSTNHLWDVYEVFGIEATRVFFNTELQKLVSVSSRHLDLLINSMTHSGRPQPVSRYGIDVKQAGRMAQIAFEQPWEGFFDACTNADKEDGTSVSFAIALGNEPQIGTGLCGVLDSRTMKPIDDEQSLHVYHQKLVADLKTEQLLRPPRPAPRRGLINTPSVSIVDIPAASATGLGMKKSSLNNKVRQAAYIPDLPTSDKEKKQAAPTVTRIVLGDMEQEELDRLGKPPKGVFNNNDGKVVKKDELEIW